MELPTRLPPDRLITVKRTIFVLALLPLLRLVVLGFNEDLGANPVEFVIRSNGTWTLTFLLITLGITPLRKITGMNWLLSLRRMLGLYAFFYAVLHFLSYVWLDQWFDWGAIVKDVAKHRYVLVGFAAFLCLIPLAATSTNAMMRRLGRNWQTLHRLVYLIGVLGATHYWWLVKKDLTQPLIYGAVLILLLGYRLLTKVQRTSIA
ncbi:MAG TPA: protein-methionine-sulfoxide reductase heme-binding subunit MsrQ [Novimethylophilus sp.]|jgi:sulfoxide reductase heme-binding subunit YedZ|uniref:sulfite oxidase heme-binding subunit YedZ n=1 Tax=Novimethylophilus sp. TaxID=2137426 RepID=UPI002F41E710